MSLTVTPAPAVSRLADLAGALAAEFHEWMPRVRLSPDGRWYERLHQDDDHEIWLISWLPGQSTGLHDHGGSAGAFAVALGELQERDLGTTRTVVPGTPRSFGADYIHEVGNVSTAPAISVHVYAPRLTTMNRYDLTPSGELVKLAEEQSDQW
ncbi:cysteine dioxygenase [Spirillospora sp. CA-294931]|uniref:cysteine dioxygenase n=1 Tax=Spirillospora sp. CA-294931 TaxID=3240042 RepID=UPI003D8C6ABD